MEIGDRVKALREKRGISQAEFARLAGEARSTVHNWETNRNKPDTDSMRTVARVLETSISYLYGETDDQRPASSEKLTASVATHIFPHQVEQVSRLHGLPIGNPLGYVSRHSLFDLRATLRDGLAWLRDRSGATRPTRLVGVSKRLKRARAKTGMGFVDGHEGSPWSLRLIHQKRHL